MDADDAITALFEDQYARMLRVAALLLGDVAGAEDVVQEAFLALHQSWDRVREKGAAAGYLHRSVVNGSRTRLRRHRLAHRLLPGRSDTTDSAEAAVLAGLVDTPLVSALRSLPPREREAVLLRHYLDLSERQAAQVLGLRVGSVKAYASRGLATLRARLGDSFDREDDGS